MDFAFTLEDQVMTGNINPDALLGIDKTLGLLFGSFTMTRIAIYLVIIVFMIISRWRLFKKGWLPWRWALIPIYNRVLMFKLGGMSWRRTLSIFFPPLFLIMMIINVFNITERFWKHRTFGLGILFVKIIFIPILAFDDSKYLKKKTTKPISKVVAKPIIKPINKPVAKAPVKAPAKKVVKKTKPLTKKK